MERAYTDTRPALVIVESTHHTYQDESSPRWSDPREMDSSLISKSVSNSNSLSEELVANSQNVNKMDDAQEIVYAVQFDVMGEQVEGEDFRAKRFLPIWEDMEQITASTPHYKKCKAEHTQLKCKVTKTMPELFQRSRDNNCAPSSDNEFNSLKMEVVQSDLKSFGDSPLNGDSSASKKMSWNAEEDEKSTSERRSNRSEQTIKVKLLNDRSGISEKVKQVRSTESVDKCPMHSDCE